MDLYSGDSARSVINPKITEIYYVQMITEKESNAFTKYGNKNKAGRGGAGRNQSTQPPQRHA